MLLGILIATHAGLPHGAPVLWAILGGVTGALGLVAFYIALGRGAMGASAAVSGLLAAAIPAGGLQRVGRRTGCPAACRIRDRRYRDLAHRRGRLPESTGESSTTMALAIAAGVAFGVYFVALRMANSLGLVAPMAIARSSSLSLLELGCCCAAYGV